MEWSIIDKYNWRIVSHTGMEHHGYIEDDLLKIDFYPNSGVGIGTGAINHVGWMASSEYSGISTVELKHVFLNLDALVLDLQHLQ